MSQPERDFGDGPVGIDRVDGYIVLSARQRGNYEGMKVSEHNAWRLFAMLALVLGIDLPKKLLKGVKL